MGQNKMIPITIKYNSWGGVREESKVIKYFADKWCKDNGYPIKTRKYVYQTLGRPTKDGR
jgi:hypothetical protein|tara:strand:- start:187 stop:366 length:180 start_codon:yes stop_codon:yes gene_type:complete